MVSQSSYFIPHSEPAKSLPEPQKVPSNRSSPVRTLSDKPSTEDNLQDTRRFVVEDVSNQRTSDSASLQTNANRKVPDLRQRLSGTNRPPSTGQKFVPNNRTLEIRKIPRELNTIAKLNEHFEKFGTVVNLQVRKSSFVS